MPNIQAFFKSLIANGFLVTSNSTDGIVYEFDSKEITITVYIDAGAHKVDVVWTTENANNEGDDSYNNLYWALGAIHMLLAEYYH
jgi:hypothetical protein